MSTAMDESSSPAAESSAVLRQAGLLEKFHIIRSSISFYNNVIVSASYSSPNPLSPDRLIRALHTVLSAHPSLSVGIQLSEEPTGTPSFIRLPSINFNKSEKFIIWESSSTSPGHAKEYKDLLCRLHNTPFANEDLTTLPLWRIGVLKRSYNTPTAYDSETNSEGRVDYEIAFSVHHAIADGLSCAAFHYSLVNALNSVDETIGSGVNWDIYTPPKDLKLLPSMDEVLDFGMGLKTAGKVAGFVGKSILPSFMHKTFWAAGKVPEKLSPTKIDVLTFEPYVLENLIKTLRAKKVSLTAFLTYAVANSLFSIMKIWEKDEFAKIKYVKVSVPMSYRKNAGWDNTVMSDFVGAINWDIAKFKSLEGEVSGMRKLTAELKKESTVTRDSEVGLIALVGDLAGFFKGQVGKDRELTFEVSNLGVLDPGKIGDPKKKKQEKEQENKQEKEGGEGSKTATKESEGWRIEEALFSQSASVTGPAFSVNAVTVNGSMRIVVQWMEGVFKDEVMEALVKSLNSSLPDFSR
ncbi:hypothetical protein TWF679_004470 [Orbilia oligospora]|uniref:Alcohol acetyltransferase n=1 Tax=Orbilia oligospora TaxID=2813651 RepID=A0A8H8VEA3_ORBOL|nr:hypothetical protein TWF679_004470 [Orbilia oligospora]